MKKDGFTLVEMALVIAIIGLVVGGIVAGQTMVHQAELRDVYARAHKYMVAAQGFQDKYGAMPGDFINASGYWSGAVNGNGDGVITMTGSANTAGENFQFWNHMALAGLIEGIYTGNSGPNGGRDSRPGTNVPKGKIATSGYGLENEGVISGGTNTWFWDSNLTIEMVFGGVIPTGNEPSDGPVLTPEEAYAIDSKFDDGRPGYGSIITYRPAGLWSNCVTSNTQTVAAYNLSYALGAACAITFPDFM